MALLESPHPSPLFRTSLAIVEPFSPLPNPPSHHREPPDPLLIPIETLSPSPGPSHLSSNPSGRCLSIPLAVVDPSGRCGTRFAVFEPILPSSNPPAVVEPIWPLSILTNPFRRLRTRLAVVSLPPLWNPSGWRTLASSLALGCSGDRRGGGVCGTGGGWSNRAPRRPQFPLARILRTVMELPRQGL